MVQVDEITVLPDPVAWRDSRFSSELAVALRLQMRGLETISMARRNGRGPDSYLTVKGYGYSSRRVCTRCRAYGQSPIL